jgi:multidrug efflux pump subunit AcrA (membrane-fusion protein)
VQTSAEDVTSKYVDMQARLHSLQATREVYLRILAKANTIGEILSVQQRVNDVQTQIEQLQGQLNVLADQTALSTLTVSVDQKKAVPAKAVVHHKSGFTKAIDRSVSRFVHGIEAIIGVIGPILLAILIVVFFWLVGRLGYRRLRRQLV